MNMQYHSDWLMQLQSVGE